jgi:hypothetical protein
MYLLLLCLTLCLLLTPEPSDSIPADEPSASQAATQKPLPVADPLEFLQKCLNRYDEQQIQGYSAILRKQERIGGKLQPSEEIEVFFREQPFSVFMHWLRGQRKADRALYVEGENDGKMLAHPTGVAGAFIKVVSRDPEGEDARQSGRYSLKEFGLKKAAERTLRDWKAARDRGDFHVEYLGVRKVREAGDRPCYTLRRTCSKPEKEGLVEVTIYIDTETWLQVGSVLKAEDNKLIGEYMFRDIRLNPKFKPNQFQRAALLP